MSLLSKLFGSSKKTMEKQEKEIFRRKLENVQIDQVIDIQHEDAKEKICSCKCLSNDPVTNKMLVQIRWNIGKDKPAEIKRYILDYTGYELKNFHLLNPQIKAPEEIKESKKRSVLEAKLKEDLQKAIELEQYEKAERIKIKLSEL